TGDATRSSRTSFRHFEDQTDGLSQALPPCGFSFQLRLPLARNAIELGFAPCLGHLPVGCQKAAVFEPVQRRIKRALRNLDYTARYLFEALGDRISVNRTERHNLQDQQI